MLKYPAAGSKKDCKDFLKLKKELQILMTSFYASDNFDSIQVMEKLMVIKSKTAELIESHEITISFIELSNMLTIAPLIINLCIEEKKRQADCIEW